MPSAYRNVEWTASVCHATVRSLQARLSTSVGDLTRQTASQGAKGFGIPKCNIEVWAKGVEEIEVAYCRGVVCPRNECAKVQWLGRSQQRPVHESVRGCRSVSCSSVDAGKDGAKRLTVAEAMLGLLAVIIERFSLNTLELQAMDNGSGRLVELYLRLGFRNAVQQDRDMIWMDAPTRLISQLAPQAWCCDLIPSEFDGLIWMHKAVAEIEFELTLNRLLHFPPTWTVDWPRDARVEVNLMRQGYDPDSRLTAQASLVGSDGRELASARCSLLVDLGLLRVLWIGRTRSRPVDPSVRGCTAYETTACEPPTKVTVAVALFGFLAALGQWFGLSISEMQALDDGSGRLVDYLHSLGLELRPNSSAGYCGHSWMECSCQALALRCCPVGWCNSAGLPLDGPLGSPPRAEPVDEDLQGPASPRHSVHVAVCDAQPGPQAEGSAQAETSQREPPASQGSQTSSSPLLEGSTAALGPEPLGDAAVLAEPPSHTSPRQQSPPAALAAASAETETHMSMESSRSSAESSSSGREVLESISAESLPSSPSEASGDSSHVNSSTAASLQSSPSSYLHDASGDALRTPKMETVNSLTEGVGAGHMAETGVCQEPLAYRTKGQGPEMPSVEFQCKPSGSRRPDPLGDLKELLRRRTDALMC
mmetsp:Transcript_29685/g.84945  ORF Transcript_29685/g.84945 Transcript_29685/m.84945 type:complete len:650 (-) Transcript_29685:211-2160(-)